MKILAFFNALLYALIAGQGFYMLLGGLRALKQLSVGAFIEHRQSVDKAIGLDNTARLVDLLHDAAQLGGDFCLYSLSLQPDADLRI